MNAELQKWLRTMQLSISNEMAYKLNFVLVVIAPALVFFFIKYNLWYSIFSLGNHSAIRGYTLETMLSYQAWVLIVSFFAQGHNGRDISEDIRLGRISSYLLYPFDFWKFHSGSFLASQVLALIIGTITVCILSSTGVIALPDYSHALRGIILCLAVALIWFQVQFMLALLSFWLEETWVLRVIFLLCAQFLSGAILPLDLFPDSFVAALAYTPFPYLTYLPVKIFMGEKLDLLLPALFNLTAWYAICFLMTRSIWNRGMRLYTGAGM